MNDNSQKYDIVMFNMSTMKDWDSGIVNRNYNVLHTLAKDDRVGRIIAVDFFPMGLKKTIAHYLTNIVAGVKTAELVYGDLTSACYQKTDKIFVYTSIDSFFSWKTVAQELRRIEKVLKLQNVIFWSYNPFFVEFIGKLNEKLFVFDTVDNWLAHTEYRKLMKPEKLNKNYQTIADKADLIFTVSEELKDFYQKMDRQENVFWVPNGVNFEFLTDLDNISQSTSLDDISGTIIGYLGTINKDRVDFELIKYLCQNNPDKTIVLAGPIWKDSIEIVDSLKKQYKNLITTGRINWQQTPAYLNRFDVGIIPHNINQFISSTNPMKMYDYLACGLPIVSTKGSGLEMFKDFIYLTNDFKDFNFYVQKAINENSLSEKAVRRNAVEIHSWKNRVESMFDKIVLKLQNKKNF